MGRAPGAREHRRVDRVGLAVDGSRDLMMERLLLLLLRRVKVEGRGGFNICNGKLLLRSRLVHRETGPILGEWLLGQRILLLREVDDRYRAI